MKIIDNIEQNTDAWFLARSGKITGSIFHTLIGNGETRNSLIYKLAFEQINKRPMEEERFENEHMKRGHELEPLARDMYRIKTNEDVREVGFVLGDDEVYTGCSPDGLVGEEGMLEIKCLSNDSEILTNKGFVPIKDITINDYVAEYTKDKKIKFVKPNFVLHKRHKGKIYNFYRYGKLKTMSLTGNHRIIYLDDNNDIKEILAQDFKYGHHKHIPVGGFVEGEDGLSDIQIFKIACNCDGHVSKSMKGKRITFEFSKERKINRLIELLNRIGFTYEVKNKRIFNNENWKPSTRIYIKLNDNSGFEYKKGFKTIIDLDKCNSKQANQFIEELQFWDGTKGRSDSISFTSCEKENIDFVSSLCVLANKKSNINIINRKDKNNHWRNAYMITISGYGKQSKNTRQCLNFNITGNTAQRLEVVDYDDYVHCVNVDSGMFVARMPNSCAFITGNCPIISTMIKQIIEDKIKKEYYTQIQYNLFVTKRNWCDYVMYNEQLPIYIKRIEVDNKFVEETIIPNIERAKKDILEAQEKLINYVNNNK